MDLQGKVALVTGSARRLGKAIVQGLAEAGADVAVHHHTSPEDAREVAAGLRQLGVRAEVLQANLTDLEQLSALFDELERILGQLDVLVNCAATFRRKPVDEIAPQDWDGVLNLNLRAPFFCSQHATRLMNKTGGGTIINIADVAAFQPWPAYAPHCISKAGLVMMTRVLARALAPEIRVNAIAPGPVLPPDDLSTEEQLQLAEMTVLKKLGSPNDVVQTVLYLLSSDYVTGETIVVDGGKMLRT